MHFQRLASTLVAVSLCLSASGTLVAQAGRPPIIDRELFFGNPEISSATLSPDGRYVAFLKPYKDTRNIWVKRTEEPAREDRSHAAADGRRQTDLGTDQVRFPAGSPRCLRPARTLRPG